VALNQELTGALQGKVYYVSFSNKWAVKGKLFNSNVKASLTQSIQIVDSYTEFAASFCQQMLTTDRKT